MPFFDWEKSNLKLNIHQMDSEHRVLIDTMNRLYDMHAKGATKRDLLGVLEHLVVLTTQHFSHEEHYMESVAYPGLSTHKLIHKGLLERLRSYCDSFAKGDGSIPSDFFQFLRVWLTAHIQGIDQKYADHAASKGAASGQ